MPQHELHLDTLFHVMEYIGLKDGFSIIMTCKNWYQLDRFEMVWKTLLSNWLQLKIDYYQKMTDSFAKNSSNFRIYRSLLEATKKFHTTQIVNEKKVNKHSFVEFMDMDEYETNERSTVFGMRFKKLIPSALNANFSLMMSKGLDEISNDVQPSILEYKHTGALAQYFLSNAKKFTQDGRVMDGLRAQDYWKRFAKSIYGIAIYELEGDAVIQFMKTFKPIIDEHAIYNFIVNQCSNKKLLNFLEEYLLSSEENHEKSDDIFNNHNFSLYQIASTLDGLECWFKCIEILHPGMSRQLFGKCLSDFRGSSNFSWLDYLQKVSPSFEYVKRYCDIIGVTKIDLFKGCVLNNMVRYENDYDLIIELYENGMIDTVDVKRVLHNYTFRQANPMKLIKLFKDFDPYELEYFEGLVGPVHFVESFFQTHGCDFSFFLNDFYETYGPFDLEKLMNKLNDRTRDIIYYKKRTVLLIRSLFQYSRDTEFKDSFLTAIKCFKPSIVDNLILEELCGCLIIDISDGYKITPHKQASFELAFHTIQINGIPFENYCKTFYEKYPDHGATLEFQYCEPNSEERLALLYYCCLALFNHIREDNEN